MAIGRPAAPEIYDPMPELLKISEVAKIVGRTIATVRLWCRNDRLPAALRPQVENGIRYWTLAQAEGMRDWIRDSGIYPGNNLPHYRPSADQREDLLTRMRASKAAEDESAPDTPA